MDNPYQALEASMRQAQSSLWILWALWALIAVVNMTAVFYFGYWLVQLIKAIIRALDRWNATSTRRMETVPARPQPNPALADALKYAPKA